MLQLELKKTMGQDWKRKTMNHGRTAPETMKQAVSEVIGGKSCRTVAREFDVKRSTLQRYIKLQRSHIAVANDAAPEVVYKPNYENARVLSNEDEQLLADYLLRSSQLNYGLTIRDCRQLAFQFAKANKKRYPSSWDLKEVVGVEWFRLFMKRHPHLAVRTPEGTSLSRATSFNKKNVSDFFDNLHVVLDKYKFEPQNIFNIDESGLTTVQKPGRIIAEKELKQVSKMTSAERGTLITICAAINAIGNAVPPFLIFPRVNYREFMIKGAPPGTVGVAHTSGWMTSDNFVLFLKHLANHLVG